MEARSQPQWHEDVEHLNTKRRLNDFCFTVNYFVYYAKQHGARYGTRSLRDWLQMGMCFYVYAKKMSIMQRVRRTVDGGFQSSCELQSGFSQKLVDCKMGLVGFVVIYFYILCLYY